MEIMPEIVSKNDPFVFPSTKGKSGKNSVLDKSNITMVFVAVISSLVLIGLGFFALNKTKVLKNFATSVFDTATKSGSCREIYQGCRKCVKSDGKAIFVNCGVNNPPPPGLKLAPQDIPPKETSSTCKKPLPPAPVKMNCQDNKKARCSWENMGEGVAYTIRVRNKSVSKNQDIVPIQLATDNFVEFPITENEVYECEIASSIYCGSSESASISGTCGSGLPTSVPALEIYHTPTPSQVPPGAVDIAVTTNDSSDPVVMGNTVAYQLTIKNLGYVVAHGVVLTDLIPPSTSFISATSTKGSCSSKDSLVTCEIGDIEPNVAIDVKINVSTTISGTVTNYASIKAIESELNVSNNSESHSTTISSIVDLMVSQMDSPDPITVNNQLTYSILISNIGKVSATGVTITDSLPSNASFNNVTSSQGTCSYNGGILACNLGNISRGSFVLVTILVTPNTTGSINNTVSVSSTESDQNSSNNSSTVTSSVISSTANIADLQVNTNDTIDPVNVGENITYGITARNNGSSNATNVVLTDMIPASLTYVGISTSAGSCSFMPGSNGDGGIAICNLGNLVANQVVNINLNVKGNVAGRTINVASISGNETDVNTVNNTDNEETLINPLIDLSVTVNERKDPIMFGDELWFDIGVKNSGPSDATGVKARGTVGSGIELVEVVGNMGICSISGSSFSCDINNLAKESMVRLISKTKTNTLGVVRSAFEVSANENDSNASNNSKQEDTSILETILTPTPLYLPTITPTSTVTPSPTPQITLISSKIDDKKEVLAVSIEEPTIAPVDIEKDAVLEIDNSSVDKKFSQANQNNGGINKTILLIILALGVVGVGLLL